MRDRLNQYRTFVQRLVKERRVLDKRCYVIIPFLRTELGLTTPSLLSGKTAQSLPLDKSYILEKALATLETKRDHLARQFGRIGLSAKQLSTQELIELFYSIYNPQAAAINLNRTQDGHPFSSPLTLAP